MRKSKDAAHQRAKALLVRSLFRLVMHLFEIGDQAGAGWVPPQLFLGLGA